jgi:GTP-binding protein Era
MENETSPPSTTGKAGLIAIVGRANVGKSSLINAILEEKVSIVSPVAQTTRNVVRGILTEPRGQLVFLDTPGVHKAGSDLGKMMNRMARASVEGCDLVMFVVDGSEPPRDEDRGWMTRLQRAGLPVLVVVNKGDLGAGRADQFRHVWQECAARAAEFPDTNPDGTRIAPAPEPIWMETAATTGTGVAELVARLFELVPVGPYLFPADILSDYPRKLAIADVIREKLYGSLRDELPHSVAVWVEKFEDVDPVWKVGAVIYVTKPSQKGIVIGTKGRILRKVKRSAEGELETMYGRPVQVELWVKIEKDWNKNFWLLKKFGYSN